MVGEESPSLQPRLPPQPPPVGSFATPSKRGLGRRPRNALALLMIVRIDIFYSLINYIAQ